MPVKFYLPENQVPLEMHKVRVVQKLTLLPVGERLKAIQEAGNNTFLLQNRDIYMDMITDSGVNAMSDLQVASMQIADDSYAGSETFNRAKAAIKEVFGVDNVLPAHQGRAAENILAETFVKPGMFTLMNFHFTTTKAHITRLGGEVLELLDKKGLIPQSDDPFKGNFDLKRLRAVIKEKTPDKIAFVRVESGTNLIGGQPVSLENMLAVCDICHEWVLDALYIVVPVAVHQISNQTTRCLWQIIRILLDNIVEIDAMKQDNLRAVRRELKALDIF